MLPGSELASMHAVWRSTSYLLGDVGLAALSQPDLPSRVVVKITTFVWQVGSKQISVITSSYGENAFLLLAFTVCTESAVWPSG